MNMSVVVDKDARTALCVQVKNGLASMIRKGHLASGKRMPGERQIAESYNVSRGTAVSALKLLESEGFIERVATRGTFVADNAARRLRTVHLLFLFPEKSISPDDLLYASFCSSTEIYQGMIQAAVDAKVQISFRHFDEAASRAAAIRQIKDVGSFDGAVFLSRQLNHLRTLLVDKNVPCALFGTEPGDDIHGVDGVFYDRKSAIRDSAEYLAGQGYRKVGIVRYSGHGEESDEKIALLQNELEKRGVALDPNNIHFAPDDKEQAYQQLSGMIPESREAMPEVFFCESVCHPFALFRVAADRDWRIGSDVRIFGYGGDTSFRDIVPSLSYLRIPYFEMGRELCSILAGRIRDGNAPTKKDSLKASVVGGCSA